MTANPPASIDLTPCQSSQIEAFGYHAHSRTLEVRFPARGTSPATNYRYANVPPEVVADMVKAESKGTFFSKFVRGRFETTKVTEVDPDAGVVFGLLLQQEPKYTTDKETGRMVNRATGKPIPDDEPLFVLRAKDVHAIAALRGYLLLLESPEHRTSVALRLGQFEAFAQLHPERMKFPDTAAA